MKLFLFLLAIYALIIHQKAMDNKKEKDILKKTSVAKGSIAGMDYQDKETVKR